MHIDQNMLWIWLPNEYFILSQIFSLEHNDGNIHFEYAMGNKTGVYAMGNYTGLYVKGN